MTNDLFATLNRTILGATRNATSSPVSAAGPSPCSSQAGQTTEKSGPGAARVSRSARQAKVGVSKTSGISGRLGSGSFNSVVLQMSLESRLQERLGTPGSTRFSMIWKVKGTLAGRLYCQLVRSMRRTKETGSGLWPTMTARDTRFPNSKPYSQRGGGKKGEQLVNAVNFWPTPTAITNNGGPALCKWGGAAARAKLAQMVPTNVLNGPLNPPFPAWLMGYPPEWVNCAPSETPSSRKSPRNLSKRSLRADLNSEPSARGR